jgi:hypothetical protein
VSRRRCSSATRRSTIATAGSTAAWSNVASSRADPPNGLLLDWHDGRCAICGRDLARLVHDHDHETGQVRGLLCRRCNAREGHASDPEDVFAMYRRRRPALILGVILSYTDPVHGHSGPPPGYETA